MGITVGNFTFTDQDYAVLFSDDPGKWTQILTQFDTACQTCRIYIRHGPRPVFKTLDMDLLRML